MENNNSSLRIVGFNGDSWSTPASTLESCWAALGAGANGLLLSTYFTSDGHLVCTPSSSVKNADGEDISVSSLDLSELQSLDAGLHHRSTVLNDDGQPTGERGGDTPWMALEQEYPLKTRIGVSYQSLDYLLQHFARRTSVSLLLERSTFDNGEVIDLLVDTLARGGLLRRVALVATATVLGEIRSRTPSAKLTLDATEDELSADVLSQAQSVSAGCIFVTYQAMRELPGEQLTHLLEESGKAGIQWCVSSPNMPFAPTQDAVHFLESIEAHVESLVSHGVLPSINALDPGGVVLEEKFSGPEFNEQQWRAGFSSLNTTKTKLKVPDCTIELNEGLEITLIEGVRYSGGAAANVVPIHGDFDATVDFHVASPAQATTFELAAIGIDPGYHHVDPSDLNTKNVNLTFDVHGAPPYASSERDQNDGFRCGWNNSFNLTKVADDWEARSVNMYNKYSRDVGDGGADNLHGSLRLIRCGPVFNSYYKDKHNRAWVGSGSMLVQSMPTDCFLRLALKHWGKAGAPPPNKVVFTNFLLRQR